MDSKIGKMLVDANLVTESQLQEALALQREAGGRLGDNLVKLNYLRHGAFEQFIETAPPPPTSMASTGVGEEFLVDLAMKHLYYGGVLAGYELANRMKLPFQAVVQPILRFLKDEKLCEIKKGAGISEGVYTYALTDEGRRRSRELLEQSSYAGPAPVTIDAYLAMCSKQTVRNLVVRRSEIDAAFTHLVIPGNIFEQLGPAVNSGKSIFLFGDPGNGKTSIAESLSELMHGGIYVPYAITVGNQVVKVFDIVHHVPVDVPKPRLASGAADITQGGMTYDQRWVFCRRPVVEVGGELTLNMLDLRFDEVSKFYEAPLQVKANGGLFIIDDFGRQQVSPRDLLNRWILPLEKRIDFLTLHTGQKFSVPFDQLLIFATNIDPVNLVDEAFLRRIRYKIHVDDPTESQYNEIFQMVCETKGVDFDPEAVEYLLREYYQRHRRPLRACHPRDLVEHVIDLARFNEQPPMLTQQALDHICRTYFIDG
jgi:hypothetical protein